MEVTLNVTLVTALIALVLTSVISFCSVFAGLGFVFKILLQPVRENQASMQKELKEFKTEVKEFKTEVNGELKELNIKLDKILSKQST